MLSDRPYLRGDYQKERTSVLTWLLCALMAVFAVQFLLSSEWVGSSNELVKSLGLSIPALRAGWLWTLLTHSFLHDTRFIFHVVVNLFALYLLGRELLPMLGTRRFLGLYAIATVVGGLAWAAVHWHSGGGVVHVGATAAVYAMFVVFASFFPNQQLSFLLLFLFPVTLKPKHIAGALVAFEVFSLVFWEISGAALPYEAQLSSSAHLGGMLTGYVFYRFIYDAPWFRRDRSGEGELPRWLRRPKRAVASVPATATASEPVAAGSPASPADVRAQIDRILDKINSQGFAALTADEKRILAEARNQISRH